MKMRSIVLFSIATMVFTSCLKELEDPNKQLNEEIRQIDEYLAAMGITGKNVLVDEKGIRYVFNYFGDDVPPKDGQGVVLNYVGELFRDGTVFDSGQKNELLENLSPEVLQHCARGILKGSEVKVYVPSKYGFGAAGTSTVPANSILVYRLYIQDVIKTEAQQVQFAADTAAIHNFIKEHGIANAIEHSSGISYTIDQPGGGESPTPYSIATFDYKLKLLKDSENVIDNGSLNNVLFFRDLIDGFKVALPLINTGTTATFYIPSGLAYGKAGKGNVPPNANLIFEIKLTSVTQ